MKKRNEVSMTISIPEFLKMKPMDLVVPRSSTYVLSQSDENGREFIHQVEVNSIADLQALHVLPREVDEKTILKAVKEDDEQAFELAKMKFDVNACNCSCHPEYEGAKAEEYSIKTVYQTIRKNFNPTLEKVYAAYYKSDAFSNDLRVETAIKITRRVLDKRKLKAIILVILKDLIIQQNAKLMVDSSINLMNINDLKIHQGGTLNYTGSFLHFKCQSAQGNL